MRVSQRSCRTDLKDLAPTFWTDAVSLSAPGMRFLLHFEEMTHHTDCRAGESAPWQISHISSRTEGNYFGNVISQYKNGI